MNCHEPSCCLSQAAESRDEADDVESYAARLAAEGRQRERGARGSGAGDDDEAGGGSGKAGSSLQDVLQQLLGGEGEVVEFKVLVGDEAIAATTGAGDAADDRDGVASSSTWGGLLESLVSGLGAADGTRQSGTNEDDDDDV